jgi:hypothetical protein
MPTILNGRTGRIALLLAGLLLAATVLPAGSEPQAGATPEPQAGEAVEPRAWYTITVPASSFNPTTNDWDYVNNGYHVRSESGNYYSFAATVPFPFPSVTVRQVHLHAYDNNAGEDACVSMYRAKSVAGSEVKMAGVCSTGAYANDPRTFKDTSIVAASVGGYTSAYLWLGLPAGNLYVYGVTIKYTA